MHWGPSFLASFSHLHLLVTFPSSVLPLIFLPPSPTSIPSSLQSLLSAIVCHHPVIMAPPCPFFAPSLTRPSVTFLPSSAVLIMAVPPSFYLSVKHNLSSPHPFIVAFLFSSPDPSVLAHMLSESDVTQLDVYLLSTGITPFNNVFIGCHKRCRSRIPGPIFA